MKSTFKKVVPIILALTIVLSSVLYTVSPAIYDDTGYSTSIVEISDDQVYENVAGADSEGIAPLNMVQPLAAAKPSSFATFFSKIGAFFKNLFSGKLIGSSKPNPTTTTTKKASTTTRKTTTTTRKTTTTTRKTTTTTRKITSTTKSTTKTNAPSSYKYVGNSNSKIYHHYWCESVKKMSEKNKVYKNCSSSEMKALGYKPCKVCNP